MKKTALALFALVTLQLQAQTLTPEEQSAQIAALTQQVNELQAQTNKWEQVVAALPKISGYVQGQYTNAEDLSTFRMRRVRVSLSGQITPKIDYKIQPELLSFKLLDAYFDYKPFEQFKVKVGQFKVPFTIENPDYSPLRMMMIDYPMVIQRLVGTSEKIGSTTLKTSDRGTGFNLHGALCKGRIAYDFALLNGTDLNIVDNNKSKDVVGRLTLQLVEGWLLSGSYYWGEYGEEYYTRKRWSVGSAYDKGAFVVRGEYVGGKSGLEYGEIDSHGWYALAGVRFCKNWAVAARCENFQEKATVFYEKFDQTNYTLGVSWKPLKYLRLQANYTYEDQTVGHRNLAIVQVTTSF